jgi:hypothetical protein
MVQCRVWIRSAAAEKSHRRRSPCAKIRAITAVTRDQINWIALGDHRRG